MLYPDVIKNIRGNTSTSKYPNSLSESSVGASWTITSPSRDAEATPASGLTSKYIKANDFGFNIPENADITGIAFTITRSGMPHTYDYSVNLISSGVVQSTDRKKTGVWLPTSSGALYESTTGNDTWGLGNNLTPDLVNRKDFGVALRVTSTASTFQTTSSKTPAMDNSGTGTSWSTVVPSSTVLLPSGAVSKYLLMDNLGFAVPTDAVVDGVQLTITRSGLYDVFDEEVKMVVGGAVQTQNKARTAKWLPVGSGASYGSSGDCWQQGLALTPAIVNAADFGFALKVTSPNGSLSYTSTEAPSGLFQTGSGTSWVVDTPNLDASVPLPSGAVTKYLKADCFDFAIPTDAHINGVTFTISRSGFYDVYDSEVKLLVSGIVQSEDKKRTGKWVVAGSGATYGSITDRWSLANNLTPDVINRDDFGITLKATSPNGGLTYNSIVTPTGLWQSTTGSNWTLDVPGLNATSILASGLSTKYLRADNFGFAIPTDARINGIIFTVSKSGEADIYDSAVRMVISGVVQSTDKSSLDIWTGSAEDKAYGSATDRWGINNNLTANVINRNDFGIAIKAQNVNSSGNIAYVYNVGAQAYYAYGGIPYVYNTSAAVVYAYGGKAYINNVSVATRYSYGSKAYVKDVSATAYYTYPDAKEGRLCVSAMKTGHAQFMDSGLKGKSIPFAATSGVLSGRFWAE